MSGYLDLAKRTLKNAPLKDTREGLIEQKQRKLDEASERGLILRWSEYPDWIALHDPSSGEWVEVRAGDCFPSLVEEANQRRRRR